MEWNIKITNKRCPSREKFIRGKSQEVYICNAQHKVLAICLCDIDGCPFKIEK